MRRAWIWIGRSVVPVIPPLVVVGAVWALLQADAANRLDYAKTLAWPAVVVFVVLLLREPIRERVGSIRRASGLGLDLELADKALEAQANEDLQQAARDVAATVLPDEAPTPEPTPTADGASDDPDQRVAAAVAEGTRLMVEAAQRVAEMEQQQRRQAVEDALQAGVRWGYNMAELYDSQPEPIIEWDDHGRPSIVGASGRRRGSTTAGLVYIAGRPGRRGTLEKTIADAEDEVRKLESDYVMSRGPDRLAAAARMATAKYRLNEVDPGNHLLL